MSTWRSHHRTSTSIAAVALAVLAGPFVPAGTAQGATPDPGPVVTLPFTNHLWPDPTIGSPGPDELNALVARVCNNGAPLADQQWFTLPSEGSGMVVGIAVRKVAYGHDRTPDPTPVGVAVVDHAAGRVLGCGQDPVEVSDGQRRSLVAWSDAAVLDECAAAAEDVGCFLDPLKVFADRTSGRPPNDRWQDATVIDAVPYRATVETTLADDDVPEQAGFCGGFSPDDAQTVWWRFTPDVSGALPLFAQSETYGPPNDDPVFRPVVSIGRLAGSGTGPVVEPDCSDDHFIEVEAGATYLISLHDRYEGADDGDLRRVVYGGRATLTVRALRPTQPRAARAVAGDHSVVLHWTPPEHAGSGPITGYEVLHANGVGYPSPTRLPADARSYTASLLENGTTATFRIRALNADGPGNPVYVSDTPGLDERLPTEPTGVVVSPEPDPRRITVTWQPPTWSGTEPVTGYRVTRSGTDRSGAGPLSVLLPADARKYVLTDLKTYAPYDVTVRAVNAVGEGRPFEGWTTLYPLTPPEPREVTAAAGTRSALVTWQPPSNPGWSADLTGYRIRRYAGGSTAPEATARVAASTTSLQVGGLTAGVAYRFDVTAIGDEGTGEPSPRTDPVTPAAAPTAPPALTSVRAAQGSALSTVTLGWEPPLLDTGAPVTGYRVARTGRDTDGVGPWSTTLPADARSFTFTHLRAWDTYTVSVQAINRVGSGPAVSRTVTIVDPRPSAPTSVTAVPGNASVTVAWRAPLHQAGSVTGYRIRRYAGSSSTVQSTVTVAATARSAAVTGLTNGNPYRFDVTAISAAGAGVPSTRTTDVIPVTVPGVAVIGTATGGAPGDPVTATATWQAPSSTGGTPILGYRVTALRVSPEGDVIGSTVSALQPPGARRLELVLPHSAAYQFVVQAVNAVGIGQPSQRSNRVTAR